MQLIYLTDKEYEDFLASICDRCRHFYEGLTEEQFEECCSCCKPIEVLKKSIHVEE